MRITWILDVIDQGGQIGSTSASVRYRGLLPARALEAKGCTNTFVSLADVYAGATLDGCDALVVGKLLPRGDMPIETQTERMLDAVRLAKARGTKVAVDVNDNRFNHPQLGEYWRALVPMADVCVAGSEPLAEVTRQHTKSSVVVIGDPIGSPAGEPKVYSGGTANLVWYGHPSNLDGLVEWSALLKGDIAYTVVTNQIPQFVEFVANFNKKKGSWFRPASRMNLVKWSEDAQWAAVESADVILIPSDKNDTRKNVKTANRLTDAIHAGRWVIASPLPAYLPFGAFCDLTEDPAGSLKRYLKDPQSALDRIKEGQQSVRQECGIEAISEKWLVALAPPR